jgi:hypothetical protein
MSAAKRLLVDLVLFAAVVAAYKPDETGITVHEWLALALAIPVLLHLVVNWDWVGRVGRALFRRLRRVTRLNFAVDTLLFVATVTVMLSGFVVSTALAGALGLATDPEPIWYAVHSVSADATMALALVHLALHWRWIVRVIRVRVFKTQPGR